MQLEELASKHGRVKKVLLPSQYEIVIREQNGDDDDTLTRVSVDDQLGPINTFIKDIIVWDYSLGRKPEYEDILNMKLNDKYCTLISSRIFSLGSDLKFDYSWSEDDKPFEYIENLIPYIGDYSKPLPELGEPGYFKYCIPRYANGVENEVKLNTSSGKELKYSYLNGVGEKYLLELKEKDLSINKQLLARQIQWKAPTGEWVHVQNFKKFSPKEMSELRKSVADNDPDFRGLTDLENPETGEIIQIPLIGIKSFFYPTEIL